MLVKKIQLQKIQVAFCVLCEVAWFVYTTTCPHTVDAHASATSENQPGCAIRMSIVECEVKIILFICI